MIIDNKKIDPVLGIVIGYGVIFFGFFGIYFSFGYKLSFGLLMLSNTYFNCGNNIHNYKLLLP